MPISEAKRKANKKWNDDNLKEKYDRISFVVAKGAKKALQDAAEEQGESVNGYIKASVKAKIKADTGAEIEL